MMVRQRSHTQITNTKTIPPYTMILSLVCLLSMSLRMPSDSPSEWITSSAFLRVEERADRPRDEYGLAQATLVPHRGWQTAP